MWRPFVIDASVWVDYLIPGLIGTIQAVVLAVAFAGIFGIVFGMGRLSTKTWIRWPPGVIVEFFRSVPVLLMMVFAYFGYFATSTIVAAQHRPSGRCRASPDPLQRFGHRRAGPLGRLLPVVVLKDSALGTAITYPELLTWAKTLGQPSATPFPPTWWLRRSSSCSTTSSPGSRSSPSTG